MRATSKSPAPRTRLSCRIRCSSPSTWWGSCVSEPHAAFRLDRARLRASFDRASGSSESAAGLRVRVGGELLERLGPSRFAPRVVLDLGSGPGLMARELKRRYPRALVIALDLSPGMLREARRHQRLWRRFERLCA